MLPSYTKEILSNAEKHANDVDISHLYQLLRKLPLADFCTLSLKPPSDYPKLAKKLPQMPPDEVQKKWVGDFGQSLMNRTCNIARLFQLLSYKVTGSGLEDKTILDYGCGWGRLIRIINHLGDVEKIYGVDVMQISLNECTKSRIPNKIELCDPIPQALPFGDILFDLIFSFSVFTHIPEHVAHAVLSATRKRISENGIFILTIRSYEFWSLREAAWPREIVKKLRNDHLSKGYAFHTFDNGGDMNANYGDTTMSFEFLSSIAEQNNWEIATIERDLSEPFQIAVALKPI